jgi:hypothetical protein
LNFSRGKERSRRARFAAQRGAFRAMRIEWPMRQRVLDDAIANRSDVSCQAAIKSDINFSLDFDFQ